MERLTKRLENGKGVYSPYGFEAFGMREALDECVDRLATYEDIGTPEEINRIIDAYGRGLTLRTDAGERLEIVKDIPTERLMEIAQAEAALKKREAENETD